MSYLNNEVLKSSGYCLVGTLGGACLGLGYMYYTKNLELEDLKKENLLDKPVYVGRLIGLAIALGLQNNWSTNLLDKVEEDKN